jgi:thioesterase family protein
LPDEQVCMQAQTTVVCRINGRLGDSSALNEAFQADFSEVK